MNQWFGTFRMKIIRVKLWSIWNSTANFKPSRVKCASDHMNCVAFYDGFAMQRLLNILCMFMSNEVIKNKAIKNASLSLALWIFRWSLCCGSDNIIFIRNFTVGIGLEKPLDAPEWSIVALLTLALEVSNKMSMKNAHSAIEWQMAGTHSDAPNSNAHQLWFSLRLMIIFHDYIDQSVIVAECVMKSFWAVSNKSY